MDKLCAIIDAQGFIIDGKFYVRELSFNEYNSPNVLTWEFELPYCFDELSPKDKITNHYIESNITGLPYQLPIGSKHMSYDKLKPFIGYLYEKSKSPSRKFFGIKNQQITDLLVELNISFISLENIPSVKQLQKFYKTTVFCPNHTENHFGTCSAQKVDHIRRWIDDTQTFEQEFSI